MKTNPPVFPSENNKGMTLYDYYVGEAMRGLLTVLQGQEGKVLWKEIASGSHDLASALMEERKNKIN